MSKKHIIDIKNIKPTCIYVCSQTEKNFYKLMITPSNYIIFYTSDFFFFCLFFKPSLDSENCLFFTCKTNLGYISYHFSTEKHYLVWPTWVEQKHCLRMLVGIIFSHLVLLQFTDLSFIQNYKIWYKEIVGMIFFQDFIN